MTSQVLVQSVLRFMKRSDPADCSAQELASLLSALNLALSQWHDTQPAALRTATLNPLLRAPDAVSVDILQYAAAFTLSPSQTNWLSTHMTEAVGCSCFLAGDAQRNLLLGAGTLARPFLAPGTGSTLLTVQFDAARLSPRFMQIVNQPSVTDGNFYQPLTAMDIAEFHRMQARYGAGTGIPKCYALEPLNTASGDDPAFLLRVTPAPQQAMTLELTISQRTPALNLSRLVSAHVLPVPEDDLTAFIRPVLLMHMVTEGLIDAEAFDTKALTQAGQDALGARAGSYVQTTAAPARVGTRRGF